MNKRRTPESEAVSNDGLVSEVADLRAEVRVLRDAIDDFRMEIEYLNRNGIRMRPPEDGQPYGVLRRMAADVTSEQWAERLEINEPVPAHADRPDNGTEPLSTKPLTQPPNGRLF